VDLLELRWRRAALGIAESADPEEAPGVTNGLSITARKVAVLLPLPATADSLWEDSLRSKVRSQIRRPLKEGFEARFGAEQIDPFYEVFARNMRDLGTPVLPKRLFESLPRLFGESVAVAVVYDDRTPIAAGCGFFHGGEFEITWASSLREYSRAAPNMLLYWRMLEAAIDRGATTFNFGRCTRGSGTHRFKLQWGGHDELMPWAAWSPDGRSATPNPDQTKYRLATSAWARLPVGVTRLLGPPLARRIP
jgi:FemAB-related protein (PEP-CTERM system-associated)